MKPLKLIATLIILTIALILFAMIRYGWFHTVKISEETVPAMTAMTIAHTGPYQNVAPVMGKLYDELKSAGVSGTRGVGIYFDSPETVAPEKCRSLVGQTVTAKDLPKLKKFSGKYQTTEIPQLKGKVVHFPYRGQLSIIFAVTKVYPELKKACGDSISTAILEIYDIPNNEILFVVPQNISREQQELWLNPVVQQKPITAVKDSI